ncbi:MAG: FkbM family methyltransferase [Desulfobacterales bacterium]|nr:FkbM family methyltransferase [Desulfobacterales bacterium]
MTIYSKIKNIFNPLPENQKELGYKPNFYIKFLRSIAETLIFLLRLNSNNRLSVETQQLLNPTMDIKLPAGDKLTFRTGHGRLLWRAKTLFTEEPIIIKWIDTFKNNDCFYDIGANVGNYTLYAAKTKKIKVISFEPEINNLQLLYENIYLNRLTDFCFPIQIALSDSTKVEKFFIRSMSKGDAMHSIGRKAFYLKETPEMFTLDAMVMSLDDAIEIFHLPKPSKLKIDVDSNELKIITGASKTLAYVEEICIELDTSFGEHQIVMDTLKSQSFFIYKKEPISRKFNTTIANYIFNKKNK